MTKKNVFHDNNYPIDAIETYNFGFFVATIVIKKTKTGWRQKCRVFANHPEPIKIISTAVKGDGATIGSKNAFDTSGALKKIDRAIMQWMGTRDFNRERIQPVDENLEKYAVDYTVCNTAGQPLTKEN